MTDSQNAQADLPELTALRGLFAFWVFLYHTNLHLLFAPPHGAVGAGYLGVDGFFILSGLVLGHRYPRLAWRPPALARFWWRRFIRLYPTVLAMLGLLIALFLAAAAAGVHPHDALRASRRELLLQLLLLNGLGFAAGWTWNYPSWSISTEWVGYLLFPLLAAGVMRLRLAACLLLLAFCAGFLVWLAATAPAGLNLSYQGALPRFLPDFLAGLLSARLLLLGYLPKGSLLPILALAVLTLGLALHPLFQASDAVIVIGLWLLLAALAPVSRPRLARIPGLSGFGRLSYCFYMAYAPVEVVFARGAARLGSHPARWPLPWLLLLFLADLGLAWLTARFVERPALRHLAGKRGGG